MRKLFTLVSISLVASVLGARLALASCMANCYLVNTAADTSNASCDVSGVGTCSLRDALAKMALSSNNVIQFAIGSGPQTISLMSPLPDIVLPVTIDGTTQPGFAGSPLIQIQKGVGSTAPWGLRTKALNGNLTAKALSIVGFTGPCVVCGAIVLSDPADLVRPGGHTIQGCYLGLDVTGSPMANFYGIADYTQGANTFGGATPSARNVISGNATGILIGVVGAGYSVRSVVQGNYIGTDPTGMALASNAHSIVTAGPFPGFTPGLLITGNLIAASSGGSGVWLFDGTNDVVQGNTIGLDATGLAALGTGDGVTLYGETNPTVVNNVIAPALSGGAGITLTQDAPRPTTGAVIQNNFIGTDITGNKSFPSSGQGIYIKDNAHHNTIGGAGAGQGNVIGGLAIGILVTHVSLGSPGTIANVIQGNRIGIGPSGAPIPNSTFGISLQAPEGQMVVGGENPGEGNIIAFTGTQTPLSHVPGVSVLAGSANRISGNSIYGNTGLGIDLNDDGVTANDPCDADTGPNDKQNFPVITAVTPGTSTRIQGTLNSAPNTTYRLEFFANPTCDPTGYGQGTQFIGYFDVTTDASCNATFDVTYVFQTLGGQSITATATDPAGSTSEFSACAVIVVNYYTVAPCRVLDTRNPSGPYGGPPINSGGFRTFVLAGQCGIPAGATAVSGNIVAVAPTAGPGFLTIYPNGATRPLASTLNYVVGKTRANNAVMRLGNNGDIVIFCQQGGGTLDIVLDVDGYFQ